MDIMTVLVLSMYVMVVVVVVAVVSLGVGLIVGIELRGRLEERLGVHRILQTHQDSIRQIDGVIDYCVGLQKDVVERLSDLWGQGDET